MSKRVFKSILLVLYVILIIWAVFAFRNVSLEDILSYTPQNTLLAILFILSLFALKSVSVFFPIILLQIASGFLFHPVVALLVNLIGAVIDFAIPYYIGMFTGADSAAKKINSNENIKKMFEKQQKHEFFLTFFLRAISCLPSDLVSMYMGMLRFNFPSYLCASILGALPGLIPATFMGNSITEPMSPEFIVSLTITLVCSLMSMLMYYIYTKRQKKK